MVTVLSYIDSKMKNTIFKFVKRVKSWTFFDYINKFPRESMDV